MPQAVISGTGLYQPPHTVTNEELVAAYNAYAERQNAIDADAIARGEKAALTASSVEFIEKASGIKQRYVIEKDGVLDPARMSSCSSGWRWMEEVLAICRMNV